MARVRRRKRLAKRVEALERAAASQEAERVRSGPNPRAEADRVRANLRARLKKFHGMASGPPETVELTLQQAELAEILRGSQKPQKQRGPQAKGVAKKITPIVSEETVEAKPNANDIAAAFSEANSGGFESDDYSNVKGMSEGELWAWQARNPPSE